MNTVIIIPALNPDDKLIKLVKELKTTFKDIILVNDGSESDEIFKKLKKDCQVLTHDENKGKGEALKTALRYYQKDLIKKNIGIITMDADGQHLPSDAIKLSDALEDDKFVLGTRLFNTKSTPLRNKTGNRITSHVFKWLYKVYIKDTQTGLRAIPNRLVESLLKVDGSRFEYELNVLIKLVKMHEEIKQVDIQTVYLEHSNKKSHFKVLKDSVRIYKTMFQGKKKDL